MGKNFISARDRMIRRIMHMDADDDTEETSKKQSGGGGNTRLPYGLCEEFGIDTEGFSPTDCWEALAGKGITPKAAFAELQKNGTIDSYVQEMRDKGITGGSGRDRREREKPYTPPEQFSEAAHRRKGMIDAHICKSAYDKLRTYAEKEFGSKSKILKMVNPEKLDEEERPFADQRNLSRLLDYMAKKRKMSPEQISKISGLSVNSINYYQPPVALERARGLYKDLMEFPTYPISELAKNPMVKKLMKLNQTPEKDQTQWKFTGKMKDDNGKTVPERDENGNVVYNQDRIDSVHKPIVEKMLHSGSVVIDENGDEQYTGEVKKEKKAFLIMGPPAAGKSSVAVNRISQYYGAMVMDSDVVKSMMPEFDNGKGAGKVHEESSDILNQELLPKFFDGSMDGANVAIPIVGSNPKKIKKYLAALKKQGYEVNLVYNDVKNTNAARRMMTRAVKTGRILSLRYITREIDGGCRKVWDEMSNGQGFDSCVRIDNNGRPAKVLSSKNAKGEDIPVEWGSEEWKQ
ncbi:MAG: zeta toxin family protein [Clostridia bacterium]|nr:zeta toxin family protein [Clostridia bacterium]